MGSRASCFAPQAEGAEKATQAYSVMYVEEHSDTADKVSA